MEERASKASQRQEGGNHYTKLKIQPMQYSMANGLDACQHTVVKYVTRFRDKGGIADLRKAIHTLELLIEHEQAGLDIAKLMADTKREGATATDIRNQMERDIALQKKDMAVNAIQQQAIQDPWIEWLGGRIPVHPTVRVEYRLRRSSTKFVAPAGELSWYWGNNGNPNDIVEYRVIG